MALGHHDCYHGSFPQIDGGILAGWASADDVAESKQDSLESLSLTQALDQEDKAADGKENMSEGMRRPDAG